MIPANSVLVFDLELLGIKDPAAAGNDAAGGAAGADEEEEAASAPEPAKPAAKK
jgi:FKBP-type peptidyl-prolyl cis-trans isomerase FklB